MSGQRHFIRLNDRSVHYRVWGEGPVIVALHGSPQSSRAVQLFAKRMSAEGFQVIAPDTPGNGLTDPLPNAEKAGTADYAIALNELIDALGLSSFGLYGFHTGAATACTYAALYPEQVAAAIFDGLPAWSDAESEDLAGYLEPFSPSWDASHMAWLWARMEEQTVFFPWHKRDLRHRMDYDVASREACHANVMDLLDAGNHYCAPYRAAFAFRPEAWLPTIRVDYCCIALSQDPLSEHLSRASLQQVPQQCFTTPDEMLEFCSRFFRDRPGREACGRETLAGSCNALQRGFTDVQGHTIAWISNHISPSQQTESLPPLVLLHGAGDSSSVFDGLLQALACHRSVTAIDLPGHGLSVGEDGSGIESVRQAAGVIGDVCRSLGLGQHYAVVGAGLGGQIAAVLLAQGDAACAASLGASIYRPEERAAIEAAGAPSLVPEWDGAHLLRAYRIARWERLFFPWFQRDRQHALPSYRSLDDFSIQKRAINLLKAAAAWGDAVKAELAFDLTCEVKGLNNFCVYAVAGDPLSTAPRIKQLSVPTYPLPEQVINWLPVLRRFGDQ